MFGLDLLLHLFITGVSAINGINLLSLDNYSFPSQLEGVVEIHATKPRTSSEGKDTCQYHGVLVPFTRDWDETRVEGGTTVVTAVAQPDTIAGYATLINERACKDKPVENVFYLGVKNANLFSRLPDGTIFTVYDTKEMTQESAPRWLHQVLNRIERVAPTAPVAKSFADAAAAQFADVRLRFVTPGIAAPKAQETPADAADEKPLAQVLEHDRAVP